MKATRDEPAGDAASSVSAEATVYAIAGRRRPSELSFADSSDFSLERSGSIEARALLRDPDVTLYSLDFDERRAVFVETPSDRHPSEAPFYHMAQFETALRAATLPFDAFVELTRARPVDDECVTFIHSVGRAGSTLASRIFAAVDGVESISEPDALTALVSARHRELEPRTELRALLDAAVRFLCKSEDAAGWAIKGRSQVTALGEWLHRLYPRATVFFLYRDATSWLASAKRAFAREEARAPEIQAMAEKIVRAHLAPVTPRVADYPEDRHLTGTELAALSWLSAMEACLEMKEAGVDVMPIQYASWRSRPEETAAAMLERAGHRPSDLSAVRDVLGRDAQAGTALAREKTRRGDHGLEPADLEVLDRHLARHDTIRTPDFEIPGTWSPEREGER